MPRATGAGIKVVGTSWAVPRNSTGDNWRIAQLAGKLQQRLAPLDKVDAMGDSATETDVHSSSSTTSSRATRTTSRATGATRCRHPSPLPSWPPSLTSAPAALARQVRQRARQRRGQRQHRHRCQLGWGAPRSRSPRTPGTCTVRSNRAQLPCAARRELHARGFEIRSGKVTTPCPLDTLGRCVPMLAGAGMANEAAAHDAR